MSFRLSLSHASADLHPQPNLLSPTPHPAAPYEGGSEADHHIQPEQTIHHSVDGLHRRVEGNGDDDSGGHGDD